MTLFSNIIVPLDGSDLSSQALPAARLMTAALRPGGALTLARAFSEAPHWQANGPQGRYRASIAAAEHDRVIAFLRGEKRRLEGLGVNRPIHIAAHEGPPDAVIASLVADDPDALIVMSTHGRGGWSRMVTGSVTAKVVRATPNPTLIVRCGESDCPLVPYTVDNIIVPLDGSLFAETALPCAGDLALAFGARTHLLRSAHNAEYFRSHTEWTRLDGEAGFHYGGPGEMAASMVTVSHGYLQRKATELARRCGADRVDISHSLRHPADAIIARAEQLDNALTLMTTHGRRGVGRALLGSVADRVVRNSPAPTLLLRGAMREAAVTPVAARPGAAALAGV